MLKGADQKTAGAGGGIADQLLFLRIEQIDHEFHHRARGEELSQLAPEGGAEKLLEGQSLDIVAGFGEVEAFELFDDTTESRFRDIELIGRSEKVVGLVVVLGQLEKPIMHLRVVGHTGGRSPVEVFSGEGAVQSGAFNIHLDEKNFRDGVEGTTRVHLVHVTQDDMADKEQVLKFLAIEGAQRFADLLQAFGVAPVGGFGNLVDGDELAGQPWHQF